LITHDLMGELRNLVELAPLHNPHNIRGITACQKILPDVPEVAVFDTAFHHKMPDYAYIYGIPYILYKKYGIRRYGFHGMSHRYVSERAAEMVGKPLSELKIITAHLGNGASITAINNGVSIDTSMGFTPLEGLIMGTRCGDIDPALVTYIMRKEKLDTHEMDILLNKESGLKGISGISNDMRVLEEKAKSGNKRAKLAIDIFIYRIRKYIGAYTAIMSGCDCLVFTAGIGENQKSIRLKITKNIFKHFKKAPKVLVIPTNEELMIAKQTYQLIKEFSPAGGGVSLDKRLRSFPWSR